MLTALRIINIVVWLTLLAYALPGAWAVVRGQEVRRGDAWRLSVVSVCILMVLGNLRWLVAANDLTLLGVVTALGTIVGSFKLFLLWSYGRGPRL
jgi:hypothetical protein